MKDHELEGRNTVTPLKKIMKNGWKRMGKKEE